MTERKKKCSMKQMELDMLNSEKSVNMIKGTLYAQSSSKIPTRKQSDKFSFFGTVKPKVLTGFFGSSKKAWIDDRPAPESLSEYYEQRKKIIFGALNINDNQQEILKLILISQKKANDLIKGQTGFFFSPYQIHEWVIALKENIANYCLVFQLYINSKQLKKANELFLLMDQQNKELLASISNQIKKNFRNMSNSNRIGKFYPTIIKIFFQILSVIIKYSAKFNKNLIEDYYLRMYIKTIYVVRETIITRFTSVNSDIENDFKLMGRFFYYDCIYNISIYFLYRYQSLNIIIAILQFIFEQYHGKDITYLINCEQILLLKTYYNLGLLYYVEGNNIESIVNLNQSKGRLHEIAAIPYTILKDNYNPTNNNAPISPKIVTTNDYSNNYNQDRTSISSFNIDESVDKYVTGNGLKKRSISSRVGGDFNEKNIEPNKKVCSNIFFGKEKFIFKEQIRFVNDVLSQKIEIEIELMLAEIELDQKNFKQAFNHVNRILDTVRQTSKKAKEKLVIPPPKKMFNIDNSNLYNSFYLKWADYSKTSYSNNVITHSFNIPKIQLNHAISESNKRHISYILEEIEKEYRKRNEYGNSNIELNNIIYDDYKSSITERYEYDKRLNENINRENKISRETEKFFIFICGLSIYQLKILNEFQPEPSKKRDDLPILFPNQFKDCLTFSQRIALNNLDTMSLSRYVILKDSNKDISPENLDYVFLTRKIKSSYKDKNCDYGSNKNNDIFYEISKKLYRNSSDESSEGIREGLSKKNIKENLFDKEKFQKFVEEDKIFNQKLNEITKKDNKQFLEINRNKILKILHGLKPKEKQLLMKSSKSLNDFLKKIEKKMNKKYK